MPQTLGPRYPNSAANSGAGIAWVNPANAAQATEPDDTVASVSLDVNQGSSQLLALSGFNLLSEDGGSIPAGATIISVSATVRARGGPPSGGGLNTATSSLAHYVAVSGTSRLALPGSPSSATLADQTATTGGSQAVPQTTFTRADLGNAVFSVRSQATRNNTTSLGRPDAWVAWSSVTVGWIKYVGGPVNVTSEVVMAGPRRMQMTDTGGIVASGQPGAVARREYAKTSGLLLDNTMVAAVRKVYNTAAGTFVSDASALEGDHQVIKNVSVSLVGDGALDSPVGVFTYAIEGQITDNSTPVEGATVELFSTSSGDRVLVTTTAADGTYKFVRRSDSGDHMVYAYKGTTKWGATYRDITVTESEVAR